MEYILDHIEWVALTVNTATFLAVLYRGDIGKACYWFGAMFVTIGLIKMKG